MVRTFLRVLFGLVWLASSVSAQTFENVSSLLQSISLAQSGASAVDINNDGLVDLYHTHSQKLDFCRLYLNKGPDGFVNIFPSSGVVEGEFLIGGIFGDYDNDGYLDLLSMDFQSADQLYRNTGAQRFINTTAGATLSVNILTQGAGWADYNRDGRLDLLVGNDEGLNQLFRNVDYAGFTDLSNTAGVQFPSNTYSISWGDFNNDRLPDILISPCGEPEDADISFIFKRAGVDTVIDNIQTNQLTLDLNFLPAGSYRWTADVSDGSTLRASTDVFTFDFSRVSSVADSKEQVPDEFILEQNYPNPFNPETAIVYAIPGQSKVEIKIYDITGKEIRTVLSATMPEGTHSVVWDGKDAHGETVSSGVYIYKLKTDAVEMSRRMVLLK